MTCTEGCSTIGQLAERVAGITNDLQFTRWSKATVIDYLNEGLCTVHGLRPDAFSGPVTLTLQPGALQTVPGEYSALVSVSGNVTTNAGGTTEGGSVSEADATFATILKKKPCLSHVVAGCAPVPGAPAQKPYEVASFTRDATNPRSFTVSPPVPYGQNPQVRATAISAPPRHKVEDFGACSGIRDCKYEASLVSWAVARCFQTDIESQFASTAADRHMKAFYDMFNTLYLQDQRFGSGLYAGQDQNRPNADPNFRQH